MRALCGFLLLIIQICPAAGIFCLYAQQKPADTIAVVASDSSIAGDSMKPDSLIDLAAADTLKGIDTIVSDENFYDKDLLSKSFHKSRRDALRGLLPPNSAAVFFANPARNRSNDVEYEYHQSPDFYYLTGFTEPNALLLVFKEDQQIGDFLSDDFIFVQPRDSTRELWNGKRTGVERIADKLGITASFKNNEFAFTKIDFSVYDKIFYIQGFDDIRDDNTDRGDLYSLIKHFKLKLEVSIPDAAVYQKKVDTRFLPEMMASLRETKQPEELVLMRKAIGITCNAHIELMKMLKPGMTEYQAEAIIEYTFKFNGAQHPGFPSIIGGAENSCILHYTSNRRQLNGADLLVVDIGAEYHGYSADVTRTLPVNGKFTKEQREIYEIVKDAQTGGISACKPGNKFWEPGQVAVSIVKKRLFKLGIIKEESDYQRYFMHGTSHYLGLDVHDVGLFGSLKPGNIITVEPGIYIPAGSPCDPKWWNIGIRIEDDVLITNSGYEVLSDCVTRDVEEIENLMKK